MPLTGPRLLGDVIHVEVYVISKRHRAEVRRRAREPIGFARKMTRAGGGSGPYFYRVDPQRATRGVPRLGTSFKVKPNEDLWVEITFYPNKRRRRAIVNGIWKPEGFAASIDALESLNSKRKGSWAIANAVLQTM